MNYANIKSLDVSNSNGIASSIFFSGCNFHCPKCFNEDAQDFNYGKPFTKEVEDLFISYVNNPHVICSNLLGGEVFQQDLNIIYNLVLRLKYETKKPIWMWTGYLWQDLTKDENKLKILKHIDVLIDGQFDINKKDLKLKYRGSLNQMVIDVQLSLRQNRVIEYDWRD